MGLVIFNGVSSRDCLIQVEHPPGYTYPERDYESVHVPGRNGDVVVDSGSYKNIEREYEIAIGDGCTEFIVAARKVSEWLHSTSTYARLEDSYEPDYYRMAIYQEGNTFKNVLERAGRATIRFSCKPQCFLKSGEKLLTFTSSGVIKNPTKFEALPVITVNGSGAGTLNIAGSQVSISQITNGMVVNCALQDVYSSTLNLNSKVTLAKEFPKLPPGESVISFSGGITSVVIVPNWWTL